MENLPLISVYCGQNTGTRSSDFPKLWMCKFEEEIMGLFVELSTTMEEFG